jgi:propanediol utilization protein
MLSAIHLDKSRRKVANELPVKRKSKKRRRKKTTVRSSRKHIQVRYAEMEKPFGEETPEQHTENVKKLGQWVEQRHAELLTDLDTLIRQCNPLQMRGALKSNGISSSWPTKRIS